MLINMKRPRLEKVRVCGWEYKVATSIGVAYSKEINEKEVQILVYSNEKPYLRIHFADTPTPNDLIAIGEELKKLEETEE